VTKPVWVPYAAIEVIHEEQIREHGGAAGVRDAGLLESALARAVNAWSYGESDFCELAALYAEGIVRNHPFVDGNKRTAFMAAYTSLGLNDVELDAPEAEAVEKMLGLAAGDLSREAFAIWLRGAPYPPERVSRRA
jgi:death-on-curing protein